MYWVLSVVGKGGVRFYVPNWSAAVWMDRKTVKDKLFGVKLERKNKGNGDYGQTASRPDMVITGWALRISIVPFYYPTLELYLQSPETQTLFPQIVPQLFHPLFERQDKLFINEYIVIIYVIYISSQKESRGIQLDIFITLLVIMDTSPPERFSWRLCIAMMINKLGKQQTNKQNNKINKILPPALLDNG